MTNTSHTILSAKTHFHKRRGFSLLDVLLALGISAVMYANIAQLQNDMTNSLHAQATANQMITLSKASQSYITANYKTLSALASSPLEVPITGNSNWQGIGDLTSTGLLPDTFTNNMPFGQKVHLVVRKINATSTIPEHLEGMLLTDGGAPMNDRLVGMAMAKLGGNGGGIMKTPPPGINKSNIQGSFASWSSPISNWSTGNITPSYGHVAMNLMTVGSPVSEWLNRYDTGNPEANRMHTDIDMNNNNLKNTNIIYSQNGKDLYLQDKDHTGRVVTWNGGIACDANITGCHFDISDDGGFYDNNDYWITFNGTASGKGMKITGPGNNLDVQGQTIAEQGIQVSDNMGVQWSNSPQVNGSVEASATYAGGWININGGSGFQGISTNIIQANKLLDRNNNNYYVVPSGYSHMNYARYEGHIGTNGLDPNSGYPSGWAGGIHTFDVYSDGGSLGAGRNGELNAYINRDGQGYLSDTLQVNGKVTAGNDVEMTAGDLTMDNGNFHMKNGNTVMDKGYFMMQNGDEWINDGNLFSNTGGDGKGGNGWFQSGLTVGRNPNGTVGNQGGGGNIVLRGNEFVTGAIKFDYGLKDDAGSPDGSGGLAGAGSNCTELSTGPGSIDFDLEKNGFYICTSDNRWHRVLTDKDK